AVGAASLGSSPTGTGTRGSSPLQPPRIKPRRSPVATDLHRHRVAHWTMFIPPEDPLATIHLPGGVILVKHRVRVNRDWPARDPSDSEPAIWSKPFDWGRCPGPIGTRGPPGPHRWSCGLAPVRPSPHDQPGNEMCPRA